MEKIKNLKNNKTIWIIGGCVALVAILAGVYFLFIKESQEEKLNKALEQLGSAFYEEFYYDQIGSTDEEKATFLKKFETIGIKINLDNLSRYKADETAEIVKQFVNNKTKKECDKDNTKVFIYPTSPYKKDNYRIEVTLDCGFKK